MLAAAVSFKGSCVEAITEDWALSCQMKPQIFGRTSDLHPLDRSQDSWWLNLWRWVKVCDSRIFFYRTSFPGSALVIPSPTAPAHPAPKQDVPNRSVLLHQRAWDEHSDNMWQGKQACWLLMSKLFVLIVEMLGFPLECKVYSLTSYH